MARRFLALAIIICMALTFYSSALVTVSLGDGQAISVLNVCEKGMQAGFMAAPTVPASMFVFHIQRPYDRLTQEQGLIFSSTYLSVLERPPAA